MHSRQIAVGFTPYLMQIGPWYVTLDQSLEEDLTIFAQVPRAGRDQPTAQFKPSEGGASGLLAALYSHTSPR